MWHVSSRSSVATLRTAIHLLLTYLLLWQWLCDSQVCAQHVRQLSDENLFCQNSERFRKSKFCLILAENHITLITQKAHVDTFQVWCTSVQLTSNVFRILWCHGDWQLISQHDTTTTVLGMYKWNVGVSFRTQRHIQNFGIDLVSRHRYGITPGESWRKAPFSGLRYSPTSQWSASDILLKFEKCKT